MKKIPLISSSWPFLFLVIVWLCTWCCTPYVSSQCLDDQRSLLLEFNNNYLAFGSITLEESRGWNQSTDCCQWGGVTCDNSTGRVIGLDLTDMGFSGEFPSAIVNLQSLEELYLGAAHFYGVIPSSISNLKKLRSLDLSDNHLSGVIPSSISNLKKLRSIDLSGNHFSSPIPSFLSMKNLKYLYLDQNNLNCSMNATEWDKLLSLNELGLSDNSLDGSIPTSLFSLPLLSYIDLSGNKFSGQLNDIAYIASHQVGSLDLSNNDLEGPIPNSIFQLKNLSYLDLSSNRLNGTLDLGNDILHRFKNLTYLDLSNNRLSITTNGGGENSSFPQLESLYLASCNLFTIPKFLKNQTSLQDLDLSMNHITGTMPRWMWQVSNVLNLSSNHLEELETPSTLSNYDRNVRLSIDLHSNNLQGKFPVFTFFCDYLDFSNNNFSSIDPNIGNHLLSIRASYLSFSRNNIHGSIPTSLCNATYLEMLNLEYNQCNLKKLRSIYLSFNHFSGPIPSFSSMKNLEYLDLSNNNLNVSINATEWDKLLSLKELVLSDNSLDGSIPTSLFSLPLLNEIQLSGNKFSGQLNEFANISSSQVDFLDLSNNNLEGPIPNSIFQLKNLSDLNLSSNRLNGTLDLGNDILHSFKNLRNLDLSNNRLSITTNGDAENSSFSQLSSLNLASCNLFTIPKFLKNQTSLIYLDLSMNHITGTMPGWMWQVSHLNLSSNHLEELETPSTLPIYDYDEQLLHFFSIDLHSNNLQGKFPVFASPYNYLDFSNNNFSSIDPNIGNHLSSTKCYYLSFSRNNLHGSIPASLCNATYLYILNLEYNHFGGIIPDCFTALTQLSLLNLRGNQLHGEIPAKFREGCSLETLKLNENFLEGRIPRSLAHCKALKVLDLGNNQLNDTFPCHLNSLFNLQVIILHSNKLHGTIVCPQSHSIWPLLQIMDVSSNHFIGELKAQSLFNWTLMMAGVTKEQSKLGFLQSSNQYYQNSISLTFKGNSYQLQYILIIFTSIDFSNNAFHGELPEELGNLNALVVLNLSYNSFSGHIPPSFGNLSQIESLDLSWNNLSGKIPAQLENLNFLEYLNLSFNKLSGKIPTGPQLQTFNASSYEGNQGLYGPPLKAKDPTVTPPTSSEGSNWSSKSVQEWMLRGAEVGFPVGITVFVGPILYIKRYREWYCKHLHILIMKILRKEDNITRARRRRRRNQQRQRH